MDTCKSIKIKSIKIVMLPWLAHGHISPFFDLAKELSLNNIKVYLCSTSVNLEAFRNKSLSLIELVDLHLPTSSLPPHQHSTKNLPNHLVGTLMASFDEAKPEFNTILKDIKPDLVIIDLLFLPWAVESASKMNIKAVTMFILGAAILAPLAHNIIRPGASIPGAYPDGYLQHISYFLSTEAGGMTNKDRILKSLSKSSNLMLVRTSSEIEQKELEYLSSLTGKEIVPLGTLIQDQDKLDGNDSYVENWLNERDPRSVVYVSFGSECFLSKEEIAEVASGLELSKVSFIWVIRFPSGEGTTIDQALPEGFLERVKTTGLVLQGWAPQAKILGNPSTGGFVSQCGWNSTLEGIDSGVPFIAMPMQYEQPLTAMIVEEIGVGLVVPRRDGKIAGEEIAKVIDEVMKGERGRRTRERANEYRRKMKESEETDLAVKKLVQLATNAVRFV